MTRKPTDHQHAAVDQTLTTPGTPSDPTAEVLPTSVTSGAGQQIVTDLEVDNTLLRGHLYLTARALKDYQEVPRRKVEIKGNPMLVVTIPQSLHEKATDVLDRADRMLKSQGPERCR